MRKKILITGASGMLGSCLEIELAGKFDVFATGGTDLAGKTPENYLRFDLREASYQPLIEWADPDVIIHCAALTNGKYCNDHPEEAFLINGISVWKLIESTTQKVKLIYISTDAVFPASTHFASENDPVAPESVYGKSKELGEFFLLNSHRDCTIIRTTIVGLNLNPARQGFAEWMVESAKNDREIQLFDDVLFTPISTWDLATAIEHLLASTTGERVWHIAGSEICSKYAFGVALLKALKLPLTSVARGQITNFKDRVKRSTDQSLSSDKYQGVFKRKLPDISSTIATLTKKIAGHE